MPVELGRLIAALESPPTDVELSGASAVFGEAIGAHSLGTVSTGTSVVRRLTKKTVALGAAGAVLFGGVAAATGALPGLDDVLPGGDGPTLVSVIDEDGGDGGDGGGGDDDGGEETEVESESEAKLDDGAEDGDHGERVSEAAQSDCGKPDKAGEDDGAGDDGSGDDGAGDDGADGSDGAILEEDPYAELCESARNHGEYVSTVARDKDGDGIPDVGKDVAPGQLKKAGGSDDGSADGESTDGSSLTEDDKAKANGNGNGNGKPGKGPKGSGD